MLFHTNFMVQRLKRPQDGFVPSFWADTISTANSYLRKQPHSLELGWGSGIPRNSEKTPALMSGQKRTAVDFFSVRKSWCYQMLTLQIRCRIFLHWGKPSESEWLRFLEVCYATIFKTHDLLNISFSILKFVSVSSSVTSHLTFKDSISHWNGSSLRGWTG